MAERLLSDKACKAARGKSVLSDGSGLRLQVKADGAKYWQFRFTLAGKESTFQIGSYPAFSLEQARGEAAKARKLVAAGIHPSIDRRVQRARNVERGEATFKAVADEWLARNKADWSSHHYERNTGILTRILCPELGAFPIADISEPVLLRVLQKHYDSGIRVSAVRARGIAGQVFQYAKDTHRATHNPARELVRSSVLKTPEVKHFDALNPKQVGPMLRALDASDTEPATRAALQLMLYTGLRDSSVRGARWQEIDLRAKCWTVPAERMKSSREHRVPLPRQAVAILSELAKLTRKEPTSFVFASNASKAGHLAENTLRLCLHRLGFKVTAHGFRSLLTDVLNERGFNADAIERQLAHIERNKVRAAYLRSDFYDYRRDMVQWLADWADAQRNKAKEPALPSNVLQFRRAS